jgi:hypothetical protein
MTYNKKINFFIRIKYSLILKIAQHTAKKSMVLLKMELKIFRALLFLELKNSKKKYYSKVESFLMTTKKFVYPYKEGET